MNARILLKACPRCRGDLCRGQDGEFSCLQCGYEHSPTATAKPHDNNQTELAPAA